MPFSEDVSKADGQAGALTLGDDITVAVDGSDVTGRYTLDADGSADGQVVLSSDTPLDPRAEVVVDIGAVNDSIDSETITPGEVEAAVTGATGAEGAGTVNVYENATVAFLATDGSADHDQAFEVETGDGSFVFSGRTGPGSQAFVLDTRARDWSGSYAVETHLADGSLDERTEFAIRDLGLDVAVDDANVTTADAIEGRVLANAADRDVEVELRTVDEDAVVAAQNLTLGGNGETPFAFSVETVEDAGDGNYTVGVTDVGTGAAARSDRIRVVDAAERTASFRRAVVTEHTGDVAEFVVDLRYADAATVTVGSRDVGFRANATVEDRDGDGSVHLRFNTAAAADATSLSSDGGDVFGVREETASDGGEDGGDSGGEDGESEREPDAVVAADVDDRNAPVEALDPGEYGLAVRPGRDVGVDAQDTGTLALDAAAPERLRTWVAPAGTTFDDAADVAAAVEDGRLTPATDVAVGDVAVHRIVSPGLAGAFARRDGTDTERFLALGRTERGDTDGDLYALNVTQRGSPANGESYRLALNESSARVAADPANDTYLLAYETDAVAATDAGGNARVPAAGDELSAAFAVRENGTFVDLDDDRREISADYSLVTAAIETHGTAVAAAANQTIEGSTTVAPGTEVSLRLRSGEDVEPQFLKTAGAVVAPDGTWSAELDFDEQRVGDAFTLESAVGVIASANELAVDGEVRAAVPTTTAARTETRTENAAGGGSGGGGSAPANSGNAASGDDESTATESAATTGDAETPSDAESESVADSAREFVGGLVGTFVDDTGGESLRDRLLGFDALLSLGGIAMVVAFVVRRG